MSTAAAASASPAGDAPRLELRGVSVRFGAIHALRDVSLTLPAGEILGVIGHNGAGKSTLVNVATGALRPTAGTIRVGGEEVALHGGPRALHAAGVRVIHQEPAIAPALSVADNITLGGPLAAAGARSRRRAARDALAALAPELDVDLPVEALTFGERQLVDLARATATDPGVLLLDEPTAALGEEETRRLHELLRRFAAAGCAIVYVSHRLRDVLELCRRVVVLREGEAIADARAVETDARQLARALAPELAQERQDGDAAASATSAALPPAPAVPPSGPPRLRLAPGGAELSVAAGEIVGLFGMAGGPQVELAHAIAGLGRLEGALLDGAPYAPGSPRAARDARVYAVPGDRERDGLVHGLSARENLVLPWLREPRGSVRLDGVFERAAQELRIRGGAGDAPIEAFSGGNRQKVLLARWLFGLPPRVLVLAQPLQGVDIGARADIAVALRNAAARGIAIVVASSESDEIALLCDRAWVCDGPPATWRALARAPGWDERLLETLVGHDETETSR